MVWVSTYGTPGHCTKRYTVHERDLYFKSTFIIESNIRVFLKVKNMSILAPPPKYQYTTVMYSTLQVKLLNKIKQ